MSPLAIDHKEPLEADHTLQAGADSLLEAPPKDSAEISRNSWEESVGDEDDSYPADTYSYGRDDDDNEDEHEADQESSDNTLSDGQDSGVAATDVVKNEDQEAFEEAESVVVETAPNPSLFLETHPRASVNSAKSFSSHTKHHSFGYDNRPEQDPSESESESESSESDSDQFLPAMSVLASPAIPEIRSHSGRASARTSADLAPTSLPSTPSAPQSKDKETGLLISQDDALAPKEPPIVPIQPTTPPTITTQELTPQRSPFEPRHSQRPGSGSDSGSSNGQRSPMLNGSRPMMPSAYKRSLSSSSGNSRGFGSIHSSGSVDGDMNDVSLSDEPRSSKRTSTIAMPRPPVAPSGAGFPSSFFGGRPHPMSQHHQSLSNSSKEGLNAPPATTSPPPQPAMTPPAPRSTSISSIASSIQGAFMGRGFTSAQSTPTVPRAASRSSIGGSNMAINTALDMRSSKNISPDRASMYSTMTTDSNMDLLLQRLEAQNNHIEQHPKRRGTSDSDMDRALGHAKEESVGEDIDWVYWGSLMHDYNAVVKKNPKQLTKMIQTGVPPALRGLIWQLLAKAKDPQLESTYADLLKTSSSHEKQILRDMGRTFPNHDYFQDGCEGQEALFNVVKAYSLYDTEVGYCQGLSFVVGPLLLNMPDEEAFCVLVRMMNSYEMRGHYTPEMNMLQLRLFQYEQLMEETVPLVYKHFQNQGIRSTMYASQWFMTLFAYKFPLELVFRVYDIIFVEGIDSLLRFAVALLKANHDKILSHDFETLIEVLKNGLFEPYVNDPSLFIRDAYNVKVTPKKLAQYAQKYQAMLQRQAAELAAEDSLREANRQLSGHVRRLEGSLHTLNKEHVDLAKELISRKMEMAQMQDRNDVLTQKVSDLTRIVDSQAKEVEDRYKAEIEAVNLKNVELSKKNTQLEEQMMYLENLVIQSKMQCAESENEKDALTSKLNDLRKALGVN